MEEQNNSIKCTCRDCGVTYDIERAPTEEMEEQCFDCWYKFIIGEETPCNE